jgi:hypothetical protein
MRNFIVIAENYARRAGRLEPRTVGFVQAESSEQARRLAEIAYPGLKLRIAEPSSDLPSTPKSGCRNAAAKKRKTLLTFRSRKYCGQFRVES